MPIEQGLANDFEAYDCFIIGANPGLTENFLLIGMNCCRSYDNEIERKKVAIFGLGDQIRYPENFADGIGLLAEVFEEDGATLVILLLPADIPSNVLRHCVMVNGAVWLSIWIISQNRRKRK